MGAQLSLRQFSLRKQKNKDTSQPVVDCRSSEISYWLAPMDADQTFCISTSHMGVIFQHWALLSVDTADFFKSVHLRVIRRSRTFAHRFAGNIIDSGETDDTAFQEQKLERVAKTTVKFLTRLIRVHRFQRLFVELDCRRLGMIHTQYLKHSLKIGSFGEIYACTMAECIDELLAERTDVPRDELKGAWTEFVRYIVHEMGIGFAQVRRFQIATALPSKRLLSAPEEQIEELP